MNSFVSWIFLASVCTATTLCANDIAQLQRAVDEQQFEEVVQIGKRVLRTNSIESLKTRATSQKFIDILRGTRSLRKLGKSANIDRESCFHLASFIEMELPQAKNNLFTAHRNSLPRTVHRDPETKKTFIHLKKNGVKPIGEGHFKRVTKSVLYDRKQSKIVACASTESNVRPEVKAMRDLKGLKGLLTGEAYLKPTKKRTYILTPLYSHGSLHDLIEKGYPFTFRDKVKIANDILTGLANMHAKGYVHRDLGLRNYFVRIDKQDNGRRVVTAVIADFGRALPYKNLEGVTTQGNTTYVPPEGFFYEKLKGKDYVQSDIFVVGCALWRLYFEKATPWGDQYLFRYGHGTMKKRYWKHCYYLSRAVRPVTLKADALASTPRGKFLKIMLTMLSKKPSDRTSAKKLSQRMNQLYTQMR